MSVRLQDIDIYHDEKTGRVYLGYKNKRDNIKKTREITLEFSDIVDSMVGNLFCNSKDEIFTIMKITAEELEKMREFNQVKEEIENKLNSDEGKSKFREKIASKALKDGDTEVIKSIVQFDMEEQERLLNNDYRR